MRFSVHCCDKVSQWIRNGGQKTVWLKSFLIDSDRIMRVAIIGCRGTVTLTRKNEYAVRSGGNAESVDYSDELIYAMCNGKQLR